MGCLIKKIFKLINVVRSKYMKPGHVLLENILGDK